MYKFLALILISIAVQCSGFAQPTDNSPVKFAFYSSAWGESSNANIRSGLRLVVENKTDYSVQLKSIEFASTVDEKEPISVAIDMLIPAGGFAEQEMAYVDLISIDQCVFETVEENWRLVEISNYTLNPSVRRLIIEDTSAFRIYQCVSTVNTFWVNQETSEQHHNNEWVLFHFESKLN